MGILNVTPDSFSDGGLFVGPEKALAHARQMVAEGAAIIDVGGESTRPGAPEVSEQEELDRTIPVIEVIHQALSCIISIDTSKPAVMKEAIAAGANMINDVNALAEPGAIKLVADSALPICLMHMRGKPRTMQESPSYSNVMEEVKAFLVERCQACLDGGIKKDQLIIDPGFGFGKTVGHNLTLVRELGQLVQLGFPLLVGISRKSTIGFIVDKPPDQRMYAGLAFATLLLERGARVIRTHDVAATADVIKVCQATFAENLEV
jgi:dihydropteroate synthase